MNLTGAGVRLAADDPRHGSINGYANYGCRCDRCRLAARDYRKRRPAGRACVLRNHDVIRARVLTWKAVHDRGRAVSVCDEIIARRPVPTSLLAAVLSEDMLERAA